MLRDVDLSISPGQTVALVGANGSGKSTLLKIISGVMVQTAGTCVASGRVGALLDVRSGIHPDLTGRENVFLYGAILGLTRRQVSERFDAIVDFAEVSDAIDRPVKFYSSGMQVRLGFAIAAHLEPAILLVDEVLAVGDASFQQKCLQRMSQIVDSGTSLIFVSHDLAAVQATCDRAVWLSDSVIRADGPTVAVLQRYRSAVEDRSSAAAEGGDATLVKVTVEGAGGGQPRSGSSLEVTAVLRMPEEGRAACFLGVSEGTAMPIFVIRHVVRFGAGEVTLRASIPHLPLPGGRYSVWVGMRAPAGSGMKTYVPWQPAASFEVFGPAPVRALGGVMVLSPVYVDCEWDIS